MTTIKTLQTDITTLESRADATRRDLERNTTLVQQAEATSNEHDMKSYGDAAARKQQELDALLSQIEDKQRQAADLEQRAASLRTEIQSKQKELESITGQNETGSFL